MNYGEPTLRAANLIRFASMQKRSAFRFWAIKFTAEHIFLA